MTHRGARGREVAPVPAPPPRGLILPPKLRAGSTHDNQLLPQTVGELVDLDLTIREAAFDAGFGSNATAVAMPEVGADVFIAGNITKPRSTCTRRWLARYRVGAEGRISHLKRGYGSGRSRLKGQQGAQIWTGWAILAYNLDTATRKPGPGRRRPPDRRRRKESELLLQATHPRTDSCSGQPREPHYIHSFNAQGTPNTSCFQDDGHLPGRVRILADTGIRVGELVKLRKSDLVTQGRQHYLRVRGKGSKERLVPIPCPYERLNRDVERGRPRDTTTDRVFLALNDGRRAAAGRTSRSPSRAYSSSSGIWPRPWGSSAAFTPTSCGTATSPGRSAGKASGPDPPDRRSRKHRDDRPGVQPLGPPGRLRRDAQGPSRYGGGKTWSGSVLPPAGTLEGARMQRVALAKPISYPLRFHPGPTARTRLHPSFRGTRTRVTWAWRRRRRQ